MFHSCVYSTKSPFALSCTGEGCTRLTTWWSGAPGSQPGGLVHPAHNLVEWGIRLTTWWSGAPGSQPGGVGHPAHNLVEWCTRLTTWWSGVPGSQPGGVGHPAHNLVEWGTRLTTWWSAVRIFDYETPKSFLKCQQLEGKQE